MEQDTSPAGGNLDAILHQPVRTRIVAFLVGRQEATFMELKRVLDISDGNLESHLKKLISADYLTIRRESGRGRQQTLYLLTEAGQRALRDYLDSLRKLLGDRLNEADTSRDQVPEGAIPDLNPGWKPS